MTRPTHGHAASANSAAGRQRRFQTVSVAGLDQVPAFPGNTSNWVIIHMNLLPLVLSIEGEEGYDPAVTARLVEGLRKWVYVACGPKGAPLCRSGVATRTTKRRPAEVGLALTMDML